MTTSSVNHLTAIKVQILIDFLHLGTFSISIVFKRRHLCITFNGFISSMLKSKLQHPVDSAPESVGLVEAETRSEKSSLKEKKNRSFTDLSFLSASALFLSSSMIEFSGLISIVFLLDM
ncbi:unnamed protein product [Microthlaspi erraticum]|uniref:Uncharacterized protein n=1 Tax=Microthlaspi erraticum TaxID=1685480 RepID=A0A6D2L033_9BRAS|nr:unnamed protein product [Microthlaspi erraticum]